MEHPLSTLDFKQWKIIAYAYAEHLIKRKLTGWKDQWWYFKSMIFCKEHEILCNTIYVDKYIRGYCPKCNQVIPKENQITLPNYYEKIKEKERIETEK